MAIEQLSDHLLAGILLRLPFLFLLQCKSVSKRFLRVISDPCFFFHPRLAHHQLSPPPCAFETHKVFLLFHCHSGSNYDRMMLLSTDSNRKTRTLKLSDFFPHFLPQDCNRVRVKATHYDVVLSSTHKDGYTHYFICNPFTRQYVSLPPISKSHAQEFARVGFMCDQSRSRFWVVHIPIDCFQYVSKFQVNMFSSETGEWGAFNVTVPNHEILMSKMCSKKILIYNEKLVWWIGKQGFLVCDPFNGWDNSIIPMKGNCPFDRASIEWDISNGRVKACLSKGCKIYEMVDLEEGKWNFDNSGFSFYNDMNFLAFHPHCEYMMYIYSKKGVFLRDYKNHKVESVYIAAAADEDICVSDNVMSLVLPGWPTLVPTLKAPNLNNYLYESKYNELIC